MKKPKIYKIKWWFGFSAITLYPIGVFVVHESYSILKHELIHWRQASELGAVKFYWKYLCEWVKKGYRNISFEIEAYAND